MNLIDDDTRREIELTILDAISDFGKECILYYDPSEIECPNCYFDSTTNRSNGQYKSGGPISFANQICPWCQGAGLIFTEVKETIKMLTVFTLKDFFIPFPNLPISTNDGYAQTKCQIAYLPKLLQAKYAVLQSKIAGHTKQEYTLFSVPTDPNNIVQDKFIVVTWQRRK